MSVTPTHIANLALDELPAARITSLAERSVPAVACAGQYAQAVDEVLESYPWSFAKVRAPVAETANPAPEQWVYAYALPHDCALPVRVYNAGSGLPSYTGTEGQQETALAVPSHYAIDRFEIAGSLLLTNVPAATLEYISWSATGFSPSFVRAVAAKLATRICMPIKKDARRRRELLEEEAVMLDRAKAVDFNKQPRSYGNFIPDAIVARLGVAPDWLPPRAAGGVESIPDSDYTAIFLSELGY